MKNIHNYTSSDIFEILRDFVYKIDEKIEKTYIGKVIDNKDPKKLGRCKIKVNGLYDDIPEKDIPWSIPKFNYTDTNKNSLMIPENGTNVNVYFENNNFYSPYYDTKTPTNIISNMGLEDYPDTIIFYEDNKGNSFRLNRKNNMMELRTGSGDFIKIESNGNIEINTLGTKGLLDGKITINAKAEVQINAPIVSIPHKISGVVEPSITGGPFNSLLFDPITGSPHQGQKVINT